MSKKTLLIALGVVVIAVLVYFNLVQNSENGEKVNGAIASNHDLKEIVSASGSIQPTTKVDITSEVNGEIIALMVREGQKVNAGDLLVVLDTVQLRSDLDQARYYENETRARLEGAQTALDQAEEEFNRLQKLFDRGLTSESLYKDAKYAFLNAKSSYDASKAAADQARARYEKQLDNLSKAKIVAPMSGIVTFLDVEVGEIAAAQTAYTQGKTLMTISDLSSFEVEVQVDETEINKIELTQPASIEVDAFPDTSFAGEVVEIGNTAVSSAMGSSDQTTNFRVKVVFKDSDVKIRPGMSATVDITTASRDQVLAVPFSAVVVRTFDIDSLEAARAGGDSNTGSSSGEVQAAETTEGDSVGMEKKAPNRKDLKGVFVVNGDKVRFVEVSTGIADQRNIEITEGLKPGDSVVSGPYRELRRIKDGDIVSLTIEQQENL